jgi:hypothetical protein
MIALEYGRSGCIVTNPEAMASWRHPRSVGL